MKSLKHVATIEGSQLNNSQIETLLGNAGKAWFLTRDEQEVANYAETMEMLMEPGTASQISLV